MGLRDPEMSSDASATSQRTRVLYVDGSLGFGGAVKSLSLMLSALPTIEPFVFTSQDREIIRMWFPQLPVSSFRRAINYRNKERLAAASTHGGLRWTVLKGFAVADGLVAIKNSLRLSWFVRQHQIDIVHLNNGFMPTEALLAARLTGTPCVVHLRDFQRERVSASSTSAVAAVIAVSDAVAQSVRDLKTGSLKVKTIHDPVDIERLENASVARDRIRDQCGISRDEIAVGIFGRVIPWKGQHVFAQAMIAAMHANKLLRAVIVGDEADGHRSYFDGIKRFIREAGVESAFVLAGYRPDVEEYYAAMDIVVHASVTPEPFGMVVPEAMAARRPVIAADAGGPREVVEHGTDGLLFPPGNVEALTRAILTLAADAKLRARMGAAGATKAAARFGIASNASQVAAVYAAILESRRKGTA
jgi:glycosyltransferase involved in cell wall biosynthesis